MEPAQSAPNAGLQLPVVALRPSIQEQNRQLTKLMEDWKKNIYISDGQVVTLPDGSKTIQPSFSRDSAFGYMGSWFYRGFHGDQARKTQADVKNLIEEHKRIYRENAENVEQLSDEEIQIIISNQLLINSIIEIARREKFPDAKEAPQEQNDWMHDKFFMLQRKFLNTLINYNEPAGSSERMKTVFSITNELGNGFIPDKPEYQAVFNFLPIVKKFQKIYPKEIAPFLSEWHDEIEKIRHVNQLLNQIDTLSRRGLDQLAKDMPLSRFAAFIANNEKPESSLTNFINTQNKYFTDFLARWQGYKPEWFAALPKNRLLEVLHEVPYKEFTLTPEQFISLMDHDKTRKIFVKLQGWNKDTWNALVKNEAFLKSPQLPALLKEDSDFYLHTKTQIAEVRDPNFLRAMALTAFEKNDEAFAMHLYKDLLHILLTDEAIAAEAKKWLFLQAMKGPAVNSLNAEPILLLKYGPRMTVKALEALVTEHGADRIREGLGDVKALDATNPNIARLVPKLYQDWLVYKGLLYAVPAMTVAQWRNYLATSPVIREDDKKMILEAVANDIPANLPVLADLVRDYTDTAFNLMHQAKTWDNALVFWAVALKMLPLEKIDFKETALLIKAKFEGQSFNQAVSAFLSFATQLDVDPKRLGQLLIELGTAPVRNLVEIQKMLDKTDVQYKFNESVLTEFLTIFVQKQKIAFDPLRASLEKVIQKRTYDKLTQDERTAAKRIVADLIAFFNASKEEFSLGEELAKILPEDKIAFINPTPRQQDLNAVKEMKEARQKIVELDQLITQTEKK